MNKASEGAITAWLVGMAAATLLLLVILANWQMFALATASQPACVAHRPLGSEARPGTFVAARSVCTLPMIEPHRGYPQ